LKSLLFPYIKCVRSNRTFGTILLGPNHTVDDRLLLLLEQILEDEPTPSAARVRRDALEADTIILAVPFGEHREVAKALPSWKGKTVIDAMNALVPPEELDGLLSSAFVAKSFTGAKVVKGFNHLVAAILATDPIVEGGHRVVFLSSDDEDAIAPVADLAKELGFAPVKRACGANASGSRRLGTVTSMFLRAKAWARA
jgi:predicted dinucleotide-binding enzyme